MITKMEEIPLLIEAYKKESRKGLKKTLNYIQDELKVINQEQSILKKRKRIKRLWDGLKNSIRRVDANKIIKIRCSNCSSTYKLELHHHGYFSMRMTEVLCSKCHHKIPRPMIKAF